MSTKTKRMLSFLLIFALVLQMLPMSAFAEGLVEAEGPALPITAHPAVTDSLYYRGGKNEYEADDVLWEIENERTETEKHFHMANGADIAVGLHTLGNAALRQDTDILGLTMKKARSPIGVDST